MERKKSPPSGQVASGRVASGWVASGQVASGRVAEAGRRSCRAAPANTKWDGRLALPCPGHTPHLLLYLHPITVHFIKYNDQSVIRLLYKKRSRVSPSPQGEGPVPVNKVWFKSTV